MPLPLGDFFGCCLFFVQLSESCDILGRDLLSNILTLFERLGLSCTCCSDLILRSGFLETAQLRDLFGLGTSHMVLMLMYKVFVHFVLASPVLRCELPELRIQLRV